MNGWLTPQQLRNHLRRHGCKQDPIAEMSGPNEISRNAALADDTQIIGSSRSQAGPHLVDLCIGDCRHDALGMVTSVLDRFWTFSLLESAVLNCRADEDPPIA